ncbi:MAG: carboxypeptidase regulatory-like domain-containing protein [Acidobacteria bacterium]|nr:carboxypeptidase regulatory-like domain-containing protein [Acidobacteriota bacterium]
MRAILTWIAIALVASAVQAPAQSIFATVVGTTTDSSGAVTVGAKVTVTNVNTNERRNAVTATTGTYEVNNLFPGMYRVEVEMPGFTRYVKEGVQLASNETARIDAVLEVASEAVQVTVTAEGATRIETESAKLSDVRSLRQIQTLPLGTRSAWRFLVLTPGVTGGMNGTMSVSGSRGRQVHYAVDGVTMSDVRSSNTIGPTLNFIEAFEEFKIDMGNNSAEFKALGTLNVATKRGGNRMHGAVYDYYTTGAFRARDYFTHRRSGTPSHGFGGHLSGPVYLPKLYDGRDKTFWFVSYETTFAPQGVTNFNLTVPLTAWKRGDFSGERTAIRDPFAGGQPFAGNQIPENRISSVAREYIALWPDPNFGNTSVFSGQNYRNQLRRPFSKPHNLQTRIDHRITSNNTIFGRFLHQQQQNPDFESGLPGVFGFRNQLRVVRHFLVSDTHIFSPNLINEFRFGIAYNTNPRWAEDVNGPAFVSKLGLTNVTRDGSLPDVHQVPIVRFGRGPAIQTIEVTRQRFFNEDVTLQWQDTISRISGKHSMRFGVEINRLQFNDQYQPANLFGNFQFTDRYTGFNFADFLLGVPSSISRAAFAPRREDRATAYDFFFNDNYRLTSSLTLNLGARYELHPPWDTSGHRISAFDKTTGNIVVPDSALPLVSDLFPVNLVAVIGHSQTAFNERLMRTDTNNFAPRVGFAWRPFGATTFVVRGGYGMFYESIVRQASLFGVPFVVNEPSFTNPTDVVDPTFVRWPLAFPRITRGAGVSLPGTWEIGFRTPYAQNWNFTLEKEIAAMSIRASYVGTGGRQMPHPFNINQPAPGPGFYVDKPRPFPQFAGITEQRNGASHTYHAFNLEAERRFFRGLMFQTSFTFAKDLGDEDVTPENTFDRARERAQTRAQPFKRWVGFAIYELPFGRSKRFGNDLRGIAGHLIGGWELSASAAAQDGLHETPLWQAPDIHGIAHTTTRTRPNVTLRPDCISDPNLPPSQQSIGAWYDVNAFRLPSTPGVFGTCGRGIIAGPGVGVMHAALFKTFTAGEGFKIRLGTQVTNVLNHPNWSNLSANAMRLDNSSGRAQITSAGGATSSSAGDASGPRVLRLDLRIDF